MLTRKSPPPLHLAQVTRSPALQAFLSPGITTQVGLRCRLLIWPLTRTNSTNVLAIRPSLSTSHQLQTPTQSTPVFSSHHRANISRFHSRYATKIFNVNNKEKHSLDGTVRGTTVTAAFDSARGLTTFKSMRLGPLNFHRRNCNSTSRSFSIFDKLTINQLLPLSEERQHDDDHHHPSFMIDATPEEREEWLRSLLRQLADSNSHVTNISIASPITTRNTDSNISNVSQQRAVVDSAAYLVVISGWANSGRNDAPQKAEEWIGRLERHHDAMMDACKSQDEDEDKYQSRVDVHNDDDDDDDDDSDDHDDSSLVTNALQPTVECYNAVMEAWAKSKQPIPARVERWLDKMKKNRYDNFILLQKERVDDFIDGNTYTRKHMHYYAAEPNIKSYNLMLCVLSKGHAKKDDILQKNAVKAEELLHQMLPQPKAVGEVGTCVQENKNAETVCTSPCPDTDSFNYVLRAYTRCRPNPCITTKVMDLLRLMELQQREWGNIPGATPVGPNTMSYCIAMNAWGALAGQKAKKIMQQIRGNEGRSKKKRHQQDHHHWKEQHQDLYEENDVSIMMKPVYDDIEKVNEILKYMHDLHKYGNPSVIPNTVAYNTLIGTYARISNPINADAPLEAESVLREMDDLRKGEEEINGTGRSFVAPDEKSYNHVIQAWSNAKKPISGRRAEWWLRKMWKESEHDASSGELTGCCEPNIYTYNSVLQAYLHIGDGKSAERLLSELLEFEKSDNINVRVNSESFSLVIRSWLNYAKINSRYDDDTATIQGCKNAYKWLSVLLDREENGHIEGKLGYSSSPELFSGILTIALKSESINKDLLRLALKTFSKLQDSRHHVDALSYQQLLNIGLRVLSTSIDDQQRNTFLQEIVSRCCDDGLVSKGFISSLANGPVQQQNFGAIIGWTSAERRRVTQHYFGEWPLPKNWSRNVKLVFTPSQHDLACWHTEHQSDPIE